MQVSHYKKNPQEFVGKHIYFHKWRGKISYDLCKVVGFNKIKKTFKLVTGDDAKKPSELYIEQGPFYVAQ